MCESIRTSQKRLCRGQIIKFIKSIQRFNHLYSTKLAFLKYPTMQTDAQSLFLSSISLGLQGLQLPLVCFSQESTLVAQMNSASLSGCLLWADVHSSANSFDQVLFSSSMLTSTDQFCPIQLHSNLSVQVCDPRICMALVYDFPPVDCLCTVTGAETQRVHMYYSW